MRKPITAIPKYKVVVKNVYPVFETNNYKEANSWFHREVYKSNKTYNVELLEDNTPIKCHYPKNAWLRQMRKKR